MRTPSKFSIYTLVDIFEKTKKRHQYDYTNIALWNSTTIHGIQTFLAKMTIFFEYSNILLVVIFEL